MAKLVLPLLSQTASNKVGDVVFFRRGDWGINVARLRVKPANPRTINQVAVRHNISTLTKIWAGRINFSEGVKFYKKTDTGWQEITVSPTETFGMTEKQAWDNYITVSRQGYKLKGKYSFISVNSKRLMEGLNPLKTPETEFALA